MHIGTHRTHRYIQKYGVFVKDKDLPVVIGSDGAGEVCAVGDGVHGWKVGDQVYALLGDDSRLLN